jgi:2-methylcitrate dehydratase PrpD
MTVARELADFLVGTATSDLPPQAMRHAAMVIASTIASAAYGTQIQSARIIRDLTREQGGRPDASLWFDTGAKLPVAEVARANAMLSDAAASDDSDLRNIVHAGTPLTATSLAFAERLGATGQDVLMAIVIGYEAAGRISEPITPNFRARGFHGCLGAVFAAAVAASRLLRLNVDQTAQSIAIAATSIGGLATAADTSVAREYHAGLAAQLGVNAALAAQRGYLAEERILETYQGFFEAFGGVDGTTASANAARDGNIAASDVDTITISRPGFTKLSGPLHPEDLIGMAHSPAYFTAAGVADRSFSWIHASDAKIADPIIHGLIDKVRVGPPPTENADRYRQGATVTIRTHDGRTSTSTVHLPKGAGALGIAWDDIDAKYRTLVPASGLTTDKIEASLALIHDFHTVTDVSTLTALLRNGS